MKDEMSRRDAIKLGVGMIAAGTLASQAGAQSRPADSSARAFVTDSAGHRHAQLDAVLDSAAGKPDAVFSVDDQKPLQSVLGFGAAFTEAACTMLSRLAPGDRTALLDDLFSPTKTNFGIARLCIGASDYSTSLYSYDEGEADPEMSRFSIDHDRKAVIPVVKAARAIRPDLYLFSSPWSPPGWMKYGGSMLGGSIRPANLKAYAQYILHYLQAYALAGVNIDAMTIQNEVDADQYGAMPACIWSEEIEASYITNHLGPLLATNGVQTKIWILDHNYNLVGRVLDQLADAKIRKLVNAVAWHGYGGTPDQMKLVQQRHPEFDMHWTEGGDGVDSPTLATAWAKWSHTFSGILNNGSRSITCWNLALDEAGNPNIGPFHCAGMITVDSHTQAITRNGIFWALSHYSKALVRGSHVLPCEAVGKSPVVAVAARRPDGSLAIVLTNTGKAAGVRVDFTGGKQPSQLLSLPQDSVTTVLL